MLKQFRQHEVSLRDHFMSRVLLPPFILLLIIGGIGFWRLNQYLTNQVIDDLKIAAEATSIRLERELAIRETILKNTGEEISSIKSNYVSELAALENNRTKCREFYLQKFTFSNSTEGVCEIFTQGLAGSRPSLQIIEDVYIERAKELQAIEINNINQRLTAYKQFFPETLAVMVVGENDRIVSSAVSGDTNITTEDFSDIAINAISNPVQGEFIKIGEYKLAVFAYPTTDGSVLAAYDINNDNYLLPSWQSTPIDNNKALALIAEKGQNVIYPTLKNEIEFLSRTQNLDESVNIKLNNVDNIVVGKPVGDTKWTVFIASPEAVVFAPLRDTQIAAIIIAGIFIVGFLWVGTFFIKKTTDNMAQLVTGAMVFGSGRLDYKLHIDASEKEFKQLADTMNYMASRIAQTEKETDERNKEFISIATHELRAPMTSIIGYLSMLSENLEKKLNKQDHMLLDTAYEGTIRLRDLVNDMLDAARIEGGREEFKFSEIEISKYINECISNMTVVSDQTNIKLIYEDKGASDVFADEQKLRIILNNFVSNAIKYNRQKGKVIISHENHEGQLITAIENTGPTIPADQQEHMFEKFFRVDTPEHRKVTGTGVGMYVTKQYVEAMGGKVWFSSFPGQNTIFYFSLPLKGGKSTNSNSSSKTPKPNNSKWIMRWRKRLK